MDIPIIDCCKIIGDYDSVNEKELDKIAKQFGDAMSGIGFAYLINHGVNMETVETNYKMFKSFFELPVEVKREYKKVDPAHNFHGFTSSGDELLNEQKKNSTELREAFDLWGEDKNKESGYPSEIPGLKSVLDNLRQDCSNLTKKILKCLGRYLQLADEDFFIKNSKWMDDPTIRNHTQLRNMYYSPLEYNKCIPENAIRLGEHSDWCMITLLFQDMTGGLEVKRTNGEWVQATPIKDSILINSGQLLEIWTAGRFPATPHRVRVVNDDNLMKNARQSCAYFVSPDGHVDVSPIVPILKGNKEFVTMTPVNAYEHYRQKMEDATIHKIY